jgi:hypothetical protein
MVEIILTKKVAHNTRLWDIGWLTCNWQVFAPAFTLSQRDSESSRKPPYAHSLGR